MCEPADDLLNCCDPDAGPGGCPDKNGSFDNCWDEGGYCCSNGGWYADPGDGSGNCQDKQLDGSEVCTTSDPDNNFEPDSIVCPDGQDPIPETFCGRGPNQVDCGNDEYCFVDPTDRFAVCCPGKAEGQPSQTTGGCLVGDIMLSEGDSAGHIGLECITDMTYKGTESTCGPDGTIVEEEQTFTCSGSVPYCVQCGPRGRGSALCLSTPTTDRNFEGPTSTPSSHSPTSSAATPNAATFLKLLAVATTLVVLLL